MQLAIIQLNNVIKKQIYVFKLLFLRGERQIIYLNYRRGDLLTTGKS